MSLFNRREAVLRALSAGSVLMLAGCFRPMLAEDSSASNLRGRIQLPPVTDRVGYHLYQSLESRLGTPSQPDWDLRVVIRRSERDLAIEQDDTVTRVSIVLSANWSLFRKGDTVPVAKSKAFSESGFNSTDSLFANREARLDVERRLAEDLGDRIGRSVLARASKILETA
ncbi:MAG: LPS assembly lipoprotein LptE [Pseudomonadota bacterium]